jgi:osmotically-inducible protein OsmY
MDSDTQLRKNIQDELACELNVHATTVDVAVKDAIATLTGHTQSYAEKLAAERAAARVFGIKAIVSELDVQLPDCRRIHDEDIARAAVDILAWNVLVPEGRIRIRVGNGWLTLEGEVDWPYQRTAAHDAVCNLKGVRGLTDRIVVKPSSTHKSVETHIRSALKRAFGSRMDHITVETRHDHVVLWGTVTSLAERAEAERAAWSTPGVCHVDNHLAVATSA